MATPEKLKIQHLTWDGDKDPDGFHLWLDGFGSFVNSMDGGLELEWVQILRDKDICIPVHVPTADNLADIFTKILPVDVFQRLRDRLMYDPRK